MIKQFGLFCLAAASAFAGQLDVAVIQFPDARTPADLAAALARVKLAEITDADRTRTRETTLQSGTVLFAQSFPASAGSSFATSTRLGNNRADVTGRLGASSLAVSIELFEGVQAGLRNFQKRTYTGSAALPAGPATLISVREGLVRAPTVVKGRAKVEASATTTIIAAQYRP